MPLDSGGEGDVGVVCEVEGALAPTYLCRASGRVKERTTRINKTPPIKIPKARGSRDIAMDSICVG